MCAFMSESWLESEGIYESDTPYLTLADPSCPAQDIGTLNGLGDEHFWLWCSRPYTPEEETDWHFILHPHVLPASRASSPTPVYLS